MAKLSDFLPLISPFLPSCPVPMLEAQLRHVLRDFCHQTGVIRRSLDPFQTAIGIKEYDIELPQGTDLHFVVSAKADERALVNLGQSSHALPDTGATGKPSGFYTKMPASIVFNATPGNDSTCTISLLVSTKPKPAATVFEDALLHDFGQAITSGVLARLCMMPGQPFTNMGISAQHASQYQVAVGDAKIETIRAQSPGGLRVKSRLFQ